jgi:hypothetical protein
MKMATNSRLLLVNNVQTIESDNQENLRYPYPSYDNQESIKSRPLPAPPILYRCRSVSRRVYIVWFELGIELDQHIQCTE